MSAAVATTGLRKRNGILAALLGYFVPPVAFAYVRRIGWGFGFLLAAPIAMFVAGRLGVPFSSAGYATLFVLVVCIGLASTIVAFRFARILPAGSTPAWYSRWYHYVWMGTLTLVFAYFVGSNRGKLFGFEPFRIPSSAMQPTLLPGDFITVDFRGATMANIRRGEIVVFEPVRHKGQRWIKRVVGLPGEAIEVQGNEIAVDGVSLAGAWQTVREPVNPRPGAFGRISLGSDEYYLVGDNRPNSEDSRYTGPVKRVAILGKARSIWFHYSPVTHSIERSRIGRIESLPSAD